MNWTTFYGQKIPVTSLSHQHLSNILWWHEKVVKVEIPEEIYYELSKRFGGIKLPYHPMISFTQELNLLLERGYITNKFDSNIVIDGKWVGKIIYA